MLINRWQDIKWDKTQTNVFKWQQEIYLASKQNDIRLVRKYQNTILEMYDAKLLAVRRVTQDNQGKVTAGMDGVKTIPPEKRLTLAKSLKIEGKASPLRRVWIAKPGKLEKRPLGIPTIYDLCLQALFKMALEPEWEAKFEENSYGFRPGRNCYDAIAAIRSHIQKRSKYVLDADITKCFDRINHNYLLNKIGMTGVNRRQLKAWLECGVLERNMFSKTEVGAPQGGIISPLLANIALHGMETFLKETGRTGVPIKPSRKKDSLGVIRYANDFVIIHHDLEIIRLLQGKIKEFLEPIGLELNQLKTNITHTLEIDPNKSQECPGLEGEPGFNFLGFYIRQYKTHHSSAKGTDSETLEFRTIIVPAKKKCKEHLEKLRKIILKDGKHKSQELLIKELNPIIRGWSNYFGKSDANNTGILRKIDYSLYLKLRKWSTLTRKSAGKGKECFRKVGNNNWTFATKEDVMVNHTDYAQPLSQYVKVRGSASPYEEDQIYWAKRLTTNNTFNTRTTLLLKSQKGICPWCKTYFRHDDIMEIDHIIPISKKGANTYDNLQLLHRHCHDTKTNLDLFSEGGSTNFIKEPCDAKVSRTVLKQKQVSATKLVDCNYSKQNIIF